jgi:hypothetical protein
MAPRKHLARARKRAYFRSARVKRGAASLKTPIIRPTFVHEVNTPLPAPRSRSSATASGTVTGTKSDSVGTCWDFQLANVSSFASLATTSEANGYISTGIASGRDADNPDSISQIIISRS